jgi:hypothetical protein
MMQKVLGISKFGSIIHLVFTKKKDFNVFLCNLMSELKFNRTEINNADVAFEELDEAYFPLVKNATKLHVFVTKKKIHLVVDSKNSNNILQRIKHMTQFLK